MGVWMENLIKTHVTELERNSEGKFEQKSKPVTAHIFEFTTQINVEPDMKISGHRDGFVPVQ
ncbi:hypothetical protein HK096_011382, partial [Nowakowskiella sp. JEL0078]